MPAFFQEVFAAAGVDEDANPRPGMIVPVGGSNVVRLAGGTGLEAPRSLRVEEVPWNQGAILTALSLPFYLAGSLKHGALLGARYFQISSTTLIGPVPAQVKAVGASSSK